MMNDYTHRIILQLKNSFSALYGDRLRRVIVYGSQARGDADQFSDIDVLVILRGPVQSSVEIARTGKIVADLSLQFDTVISCQFMDENRYLNRNGPFLRNIRREGVPV
ncbi:MAG: nucleotidyltransferase domain-containing protein [Caldilinea sp.]